MIPVVTTVVVHELAIMEFGGATGIRDMNLLESALSCPFQTFDGIDLYQSPYLKAAAILGSILINHPFIDGNKRTAYMLMNIILHEADIQLTASQDELYDFIIDVITKRRDIEIVGDWIKKNSQIV